MILDAAHLARMRARADAEFYTAVKLAEANKVPSCGMKYPWDLIFSNFADFSSIREI